MPTVAPITATIRLSVSICRIRRMRVAPSDEELGLDLALHGEAAYQA